MTEQLFDSKKFLTDVSSQPGVYRMYNKKEEVIYVGKAKNLKKRLSSYFRANVNSVKTAKLVSQIVNIEVTITTTETEALLLEHNYIKRYKPRYNVLLRDDKSYPYILLSQDKHPRISMHRGSKRAKGEFFGPYPNSSAVHETLSLLQKIFPIRQCSNTFYSHRSRPCLQYQIGRCSAPCVAGHVTDEEYGQQVNLVRMFLQGRDQQVLTQLVNKMESASQQLEFEKAATIRDQIQSVRAIVEKQSIENKSQNDIDIIAILYELGIACVHVIFVRQGKIMGNRSYFPKLPAETEIEELTETFIGQFYLENKSGRSLPRKIILDQKLNNKTQLTTLLSEQFERKVVIQDHAKGSDLKFLNLAQLNARTALGLQVKSTGTVTSRYKALKERLSLNEIKRMECFDISHTMGEQTIASCVVFNDAGPHKQEYRRYNIEGITPGDDYAAMEQVLTRRYSKAIDDEKIPDIIFIDGGKGQLGRAIDVFKHLDVSWDKHKPILIGVAKGVERKAGLETLIIAKSGKEIHLDADDSALHLIQHIRDESHRFAITGHRHKRGKQFTESGLESVPGIGAKRRQALLKYFGGMQGIKSANVDELASVPGISKQLAEQIVEIFHQE